RHVVPVTYFINNDLGYLKGGGSSSKYATSTIRTKVAKMMRADELYKFSDGTLNDVRSALHDIAKEVILNGNSPTPTRVVNAVVQPVAPTTAEQILAKKNELKAKGTLLMALLDKNQLKFNIHKDAMSLMEAIEKRFGGNKEAKKVQKTLVKEYIKKDVEVPGSSKLTRFIAICSYSTDIYKDIKKAQVFAAALAILTPEHLKVDKA
nr:hypothetical protein [Tanacetum cinerariifolium]